MKKPLKLTILLTVLSALLVTESCRENPQIKTLIITGQNMNWKRNIIALSFMFPNWRFSMLKFKYHL